MFHSSKEENLGLEEFHPSWHCLDLIFLWGSTFNILSIPRYPIRLVCVVKNILLHKTCVVIAQFSDWLNLTDPTFYLDRALSTYKRANLSGSEFPLENILSCFTTLYIHPPKMYSKLAFFVVSAFTLGALATPQDAPAPAPPAPSNSECDGGKINCC
jgi:hypothetical protein